MDGVEARLSATRVWRYRFWEQYAGFKVSAAGQHRIPSSGAFRLTRGALVCALLAVAGCATGGIRLEHAIKLAGSDGKKLWKLEPEPGGVELEDAYARNVHRFRYNRGAIRFKDSREKRLEIVPSPKRDGTLLLRNQETGRLLYRFLREADGDYRLEDGEGTLIYDVKRRNYGYKVLEPGGRHFKVRGKRGKVSIRESSGATVLSTHDPISPLAASSFSFDELPIGMRAALCLGVLRWNLDGG